MLHQNFGIGEGEMTWSLDVPSRQIRFMRGETLAAVATISIVGTHLFEKNEFLWWWANPQRDAVPHYEAAALTVPSGIETAEALTLERLGKQPLIVADEKVAMALAATLALRLGAASAYRTSVPNGSLWTYWVLHTVQEIVSDEKMDPVGVEPTSEAPFQS